MGFRILGFFILLNLVHPISFSNSRTQTIQQYIETFSSLAIEEMRLHGIPASIKLAQGILESGFGNSELARQANNHFGIKCHGWAGRTFLRDDDKPNECFRAYNSAEESYRDHSQFLLTRPWYAPLFELEITDYEGWARGLQRAGYATNPRYAEKLIRIIKEHGLARFDSMGLGLIPNPNPPKVHFRPARTNNDPISLSPAQQAQLGAGGALKPERIIMTNNRILCIIAVEGDTPESIAEEMGMHPWQIIRYNELEAGRTIVPGMIVYLQPKRRQGVNAVHIVQQGETLYEIAQKHGIQLRFLKERNNLEPWQTISTGQKLLLRGRMNNNHMRSQALVSPAN